MADAGLPEAQNALGIMCSKGDGGPVDLPMAARWFRKAAEQGLAGAQSNLGSCFAEGVGVTKDYSEAVKWFRKAADQGDADGLCNLGVMYAKGAGVAKDREEALRLLNRSADLGCRQAVTARAALVKTPSLPEGNQGATPAQNPQRPKPQLVRELIPQLNHGLELGMYDNNILQKVFAELDSSPETLLPDAADALQVTAFLLWKCGRSAFARRLLFTCLAWYLKNSKDQVMIELITGNLKHIYEKEGHPATVEQIHDAAIDERFGQEESWRLDISGFDAKPVVEISAGIISEQRTRYSAGFTPSIKPRMPLTTFRGWLKRLDPAVLNAMGKQTIKHVFLFFGAPTPDDFLDRADRLTALGVKLGEADLADVATLRDLTRAGVETKIVRHRRFSGGDGLLPRGCYTSICKDSAGNDDGSMSRELLAYVDLRIPGLVYAGDSTSEKLTAFLRNPPRPLPGYCVEYVFLIAPQIPEQKVIFDSFYGELLAAAGDVDRPIHAFVFETRVDESTIEGVIDLRLPRTQEWFFEHFKNGDGHFLTKNVGTAREFYDLVPTLMHPAIGGSEVTHAIGSWMRSSGVNALIYPSARSDASVDIRNGELVASHGWNLVDYRGASALPATELTKSVGGWPDFLQPTGFLQVANGGELAGSWKVTGLQIDYDKMRRQIEGLHSDASDQIRSSPLDSARVQQEPAPSKEPNDDDSVPDISPSS
jgi:hypothetical protein